MIIINKIEEMKKYYKKDIYTYVFNDDVKFNIDINIDAHNIDAYNIDAHNINAYNIDAHNINAYDIDAYDIDAHNINAYDIDAHNINAYDIDAYNIDAYEINAHNINAYDIDAYDIDACEIIYYAVCIAYRSFKCESIKGRRDNSIHKCLDHDIEYKVKSCIDEETEKAIKLLQEKNILGEDFNKNERK